MEKSFPEGAYIWHRGDRFDFWTGISSGLVKVSTVSKTGKAMTFAGIRNGGWFGEGSMLKDEDRQYDVVALRATRLAMMNRATCNVLITMRGVTVYITSIGRLYRVCFGT